MRRVKLLDGYFNAVFQMIATHIGITPITDAEVLRARQLQKVHQSGQACKDIPDFLCISFREYGIVLAVVSKSLKH